MSNSDALVLLSSNREIRLRASSRVPRRIVWLSESHIFHFPTAING